MGLIYKVFHTMGKSTGILSSLNVLLRNNVDVGHSSRTLIAAGIFSQYLKIHGSTQVHLLQQASKRAYGTGRVGGTSATDASDLIKIENRKLVANLLGINEDEVTRVPFKMINREKAMHTLEVLRRFGFYPSSVHLYPELLLMSGGAVENYIRIMHESGFPDVREVFIIRFRTVYKQSLSVLQRKVSLPDLNSIVERYCSEVEEDHIFCKEFIKKLPRDNDKMTIFDLRKVFMGRYLGKILLGSLDESLNAFSKYPRLYYRCLNWVKRNYRLLIDFGFSNEKVKSHFYLLHANPENLSRILEIKSLAGLDMKKIGHLRPKILMSTYDTLMDIEQSFINHEISFEAVQKYLEVYTLSATTIRQRLQEMDSIPEFRPLKSHPRVARLLYYQNKAKSRLEVLKKLEVRVPSLHLLSTDIKRFNRSLTTGDFRVKGVDVMIHLSEILQVDRQRIHESISRHPHWLHIPLVNIKSVLKFIQSVGNFSTDQLVDAIPILLYPKEKVEIGFENLLKSGEATLNDSYFLHIVLYYLERPQHFTGDAVWPEKDIHPDEEDESHKSSEVNK